MPKGWHVHHIDHDRTNNNPLNLVALPGDVHGAYHFAEQVYNNEFNQWGHLEISEDDKRFNMLAYYDESFREWYDGDACEFLDACNWINSKAGLLLRVDKARALFDVAMARVDLYVQDQRSGVFNLFTDKTA